MGVNTIILGCICIIVLDDEIVDVNHAIELGALLASLQAKSAAPLHLYYA